MNGRQRDSRLVIGPPPRVDLLPPEVRDARRARAAQRGVFGSLAVVVLLSALAAGQAFLGTVQSAAELASAQETSRSLLSGQSAYASITGLQARVAAGTRAEAAAGANWIDWRAYVADVVAALPPGARLTSFDSGATAAGASPAAAGAQPAAALGAAPTGTVVTLTLTASVADLGAVQSWISDLSTLPGYLDAAPGAVTSANGALQAQVVVYLGADAYSARPAVSAPRAPTPRPSASPTASTAPAPLPTPTETAQAGSTPAPDPTSTSTGVN